MCICENVIIFFFVVNFFYLILWKIMNMIKLIDVDFYKFGGCMFSW